MCPALVFQELPDVLIPSGASLLEGGLLLGRGLVPAQTKVHAYISVSLYMYT